MACTEKQAPISLYESKDLVIERISDHVFQHVSYLDVGEFGKVACNGIVVIDGDEAIVFDTPTNDAIFKELIDWIQDSIQRKIVAIIPTHFHADCLGGLEEFHMAKVPSFAHSKTIELARIHESAIPQNEMDEHLELKVGQQKVQLDYFGEGHTSDNIVGYFPEDGILFGGCLVKEEGASVGNLEDANTSEWVHTIKKLQNKYPAIKTVVPGHGQIGGKEFLDYTISLFEKWNQGDIH